jgi:hypothetical protein
VLKELWFASRQQLHAPARFFEPQLRDRVAQGKIQCP